MNDMHFVFAAVLGAILLFGSGRARMDFVALALLLTLYVGGILTVDEACAGFGNPVVVLVAGLLVLGEMLDRTGVAQAIGNRIVDLGGTSYWRIIVLVMTSTALLSSLMSSTAVVAIFIPIIYKVSARASIPVSRLLLPMALAAMISGMLTLIATMPNMVISDALSSAGYDPLGFFSFSPIGLTILAIGIAYSLTIGGRLLPTGDVPSTGGLHRPLRDLWQQFSIGNLVETLQLPQHSSLVGQTLEAAEIESQFGLRVLVVIRRSHNGNHRNDEILEPDAGLRLRAGDILLLAGETCKLEPFLQQFDLRVHRVSDGEKRRLLQERGAAVFLMHPDSQYLGKSIRQMNLRNQYGVHVLGVRRNQETMDDFTQTPLKGADMLLVSGRWQSISSLGQHRQDFVLTELPAEFEEARPRFRMAPLAIGLIVLMVVLSILEVVPITIAVLLTAIAAVVSRCLTAEDAYRSISWSSLVLLAGMLPVAVALEKTEGTQWIVQQVVAAVGDDQPYLMISALFVLTATLSLFLSNTATAVLLAPVAIEIARTMDVSPYPMAITVLIGASAALATPVSSPVMTLIVEPGRYRFIDFMKIGSPLMVLIYLANLILTPWFFPL